MDWNMLQCATRDQSVFIQWISWLYRMQLFFLPTIDLTIAAQFLGPSFYEKAYDAEHDECAEENEKRQAENHGWKCFVVCHPDDVKSVQKNFKAKLRWMLFLWVWPTYSSLRIKHFPLSMLVIRSILLWRTQSDRTNLGQEKFELRLWTVQLDEVICLFTVINTKIVTEKNGFFLSTRLYRQMMHVW